MDIDVWAPGGLAVHAVVNGFVVPTDQSVEEGGEGGAPSPFDLFLASIATCAGYYALRFCRERALDTTGLAVSLHAEKDRATKLVGRIGVDLTLPAGFPEKYRPAILRAVDQCTVKRHLAHPPSIETTLLEPELVTAPS